MGAGEGGIMGRRPALGFRLLIASAIVAILSSRRMLGSDIE